MLLLLYWIVGGAVVGWLTGMVMSSEGRDYVMDIVMGVAGAVGGAFLFSTIHFSVEGKMSYTVLAAIVGAATLAGLTRYVGGNLEYGSTSRRMIRWLDLVFVRRAPYRATNLAVRRRR